MKTRSSVLFLLSLVCLMDIQTENLIGYVDGPGSLRIESH